METVRLIARALCLAGGIFISSAAPAQEAPQPHVIDLSPTCAAVPPAFQDWTRPLDWSDLAAWGRSRGWALVAEDLRPGDRCAVMVRRAGSTLAVTGLDARRRYRLYVEFVRYRLEHGRPYPSRLTITGGTDNRVIASLTQQQLPAGFLTIELPYELTIRGALRLQFIESALVGGLWGVRRLIVADTREVPRPSAVETRTPNLDPQERLVE